MTRPTPKKPKPDVQRGRAYAEGGDTPMHGKGDRTKVSTADSAGEQTPAITSQKAKDKAKFARGGGDQMFPRQAAEKAAPGQVGKPATPVGSRRASGGLDAVGGIARPAKPGQCAP